MTPTQERYAAAVREHGSVRAAARALGKAPSTVCEALKRAAVDPVEAVAANLLDYANAPDRRTLELGDNPEAVAKALARTRARAAQRGWAPDYGWTHPVPEPHVAQGVSTMRRIKLPDGTDGVQWVKSRLDDTRARELMAQAAEEFARPLRGLGKLPVAPRFADAELFNVFVMGDPHIGMLAWAKETLGQDYDLGIAEATNCAAIKHLVADAPRAEHAVVLNLGDALHADNYGFLTQSGHRLDADSRMPRMIEVAVRTFKTIGHYVAAAHRSVTWENIDGNHDRNAVPWLNIALREYWHREPRVEVNCSPSSNHKFRRGKVLIGMTHGDRVKGRFGKKRPYSPQDFIAVMANDWAEDWGQCRYRYGLQGHIHSANEIEASGGRLLSFQTIAPGDAWHAAQLYRSGQSMTRLTFHVEHGLIGRGHVPLSMIEAAA